MCKPPNGVLIQRYKHLYTDKVKVYSRFDGYWNISIFSFTFLCTMIVAD